MDKSLRPDERGNMFTDADIEKFRINFYNQLPTLCGILIAAHPDYMPPESASGEAITLCNCILYELKKL